MVTPQAAHISRALKRTDVAPLRQIAVFPSHPKDRHAIAGGAILTIYELVAEVRAKVIACGVARSAAISENYQLLRVLQLSHCDYNRALTNPAVERECAKARNITLLR